MLYFQGRAVLEVIEALEKISAGKGVARPKVVRAHFSQPYLKFEKEIDGDKLPLPKLFEELKGTVQKEATVARLTSIELNFGEWVLTLNLPVEQAWWTIEVRSKSGNPQPPLQHEQVSPWMYTLAQALTATPDKPAVSGDVKEARAATEIQIAASRRMEDVAADIAEQLGKVAIERDRALTKRQEEFEASMAKRTEQLSKERIAFEQEKAERDSREATVVRRQLLKETLTALDAETSVVLSPETNRKRRYIYVALGLAMLLGISLVVTAIYREIAPSPEKSAEALVLLRSLAVSGIVLFGSSLWYFVRWEDRWQQTHATAELQNRKNRKDMLRASWLAELSIEVGKDEKAKLDPALLEEMSRGLFVAPDEAQVTEHPLEVLFKRARLDRLKFGKTGIELTKRTRPDR
jgi:hypothetical protein